MCKYVAFAERAADQKILTLRRQFMAFGIKTRYNIAFIFLPLAFCQQLAGQSPSFVRKQIMDRKEPPPFVTGGCYSSS